MKNNFQIILIAVFVAFFVFAVLIFSGILPIGKSSNGPTNLAGHLTVWGTFPSADVATAFSTINSTNRDLTVSYVTKPEATYQQSLIEAFANGTGPDLFFISQDMLLKNQNFIYALPPATYPTKVFQDGFIDGASEVYIGPDGVLGMPIVVDPLVLYYNRNLLSNAGIVAPPAYWDELFTMASSLTSKQNDGTILQSMIALGQFDNVAHAKDIIASLLIQNGNPIVSKTGGKPNAVLSTNASKSSAESVMTFFTQFANPANSAYSWNRALPNSKDMFTGGKLAFYIGRASELFNIESVNPNLSFDVSALPQTRGASIKRTYGNIYALSVNKRSPNASTAFAFMGLLSSGEPAKIMATALSLPPVGRALLADKPTDPYLFTFYNSAIISHGWLDPDKAGSDSVFSELVNNILSAKLSIPDAIAKAQGQLDILLGKQFTVPQ